MTKNMGNIGNGMKTVKSKRVLFTKRGKKKGNTKNGIKQDNFSSNVFTRMVKNVKNNSQQTTC